MGRLGGARMARGGHRAAEQRPPAGGGSELKPAAAAARGDESGAPGRPAAMWIEFNDSRRLPQAVRS